MSENSIMLPVFGCDQCEAIVEAVGLDSATACIECEEYGEGEVVSPEEIGRWSTPLEHYDDGQPDWAQEWHDFDPEC